MSLLLRRRILSAIAKVNEDDGRWCYAVSDKNLWVSNDHGAHWTDLGLVGTGSVVAVSPNGYGIAIGSSRVVVAGPNTAPTQRSTVPNSERGLSPCASSGSTVPQYIHLASHLNSTRKIYQDNNGTLTVKNTESDSRPLSISGSACSDDGKYALIMDNALTGRAWYTTNFGSTWSSQNLTDSSSYPGLETQRVCISSNGQVQFAVVGNHLWLSKDYGANWETKLNSQNAVACAMTADGTKVYVSSDTSGVKCADISEDSWKADVNWTSLSSNNFINISCNSSGDRLVAVKDNSVYYSEDAGYNWTLAKEGLFLNAVMARGSVPTGPIVTPPPQVSINLNVESPGWGQGSATYVDAIPCTIFYSNRIGDSRTTSMTATNNGPAFTAWIENDSEQGYDYVYVTCNGSTIASGASSVNTKIAFTFPANSTITVTYRKDGSASSGADTGYLYLPTSVITGVEHEVKGGAGNLTIVNNWESTGTSEGYTYFHSTNHSDSSSSELVIDCMKAVSFTFAVRVSSESGYDYLTVYLDNTQLWRNSGTGGDYQELTVNFLPGQRIRLVYSKDGSASVGDDEGCLRILSSLIVPSVIIQ